MKNDNSVFNSGAAGYILSRETMKKLVDQWDHNDPFCTGKSADKWLQGNPGKLENDGFTTTINKRIESNGRSQFILFLSSQFYNIISFFVL